jgi:hypothetical protein
MLNKLLALVLIILVGQMYGQSSVLSSGDWYKFAVNQDGVHKLTYQNLLDLGIISAPVQSHQIALFSNAPGMLPEENWAQRPFDLQQISIEVIDGNDNIFGPGDYLLFYGADQIVWTYNSDDGLFSHKRNLYDTYTYFFLTTQWQNGLRISSSNLSLINPDNFVNSFIDYQLHEIEQKNFIHSGKQWFGESFEEQPNQLVNFSFANIIQGRPVTCTIDLVSRSLGTSNSNIFNYSAGSVSGSFNVTNVSNNYLNDFVRAAKHTFEFNATNAQIGVNIEFIPFNDDSKAWLNYITVQAHRNLTIGSGQLLFRDTTALGLSEVNNYFLEGVSVLHQVWDISDFSSPIKVNGNILQDIMQFQSTSNTLKEFVCFNSLNTLNPIFIGAVENQNLKGQPFANGFIITHPDFINQANQLASFHQQNSGLSVNVATTTQIYNEFSGGAADITAIKDYLRHFYNNASNDSQKPQYLTILGDASYDYLGHNYPNSSFVPTFQSQNSFALITSYGSDDYFGLLDNNESNALNQLIDIGIGRLPAKSVAEAQALVNKIIAYKTEAALGPWQNKMLFVADDEDNNLHMSQSNLLATTMQGNNCPLYVQKLFFDAFEQVSTPDGPRYPEVNERLVNKVESGILICNYTGHSGTANWSGEQVLTPPMIDDFQNAPRFPMFFMANCEFSKFDSPQLVSGSEMMMLNENGGAIACVSNARVGYSSSNYVFNNHFNNNIFTLQNGAYPRLGDLIANAKNASVSANIMNHRSVNLMGDAMLKLNYAQNQVNITLFNSEPVEDSNLSVPFSATLQIDGEVNSMNGDVLSGFNGELHYLILDKQVPVITLANDTPTPFEFSNWQDTITSGTAEVINGLFSFQAFAANNGSDWAGQGKLILYAKAGMETAAGCLNGLNIIQSPVAVSEFELLAVSYYPNPVKDNLRIEPGEALEEFWIQVTDLNGSVLYRKDYQNSNIAEIPFQQLASGVYLLEIQADKKRSVVRVVKP